MNDHWRDSPSRFLESRLNCAVTLGGRAVGTFSFGVLVISHRWTINLDPYPSTS
jgi:hypothetical protein